MSAYMYIQHISYWLQEPAHTSSQSREYISQQTIIYGRRGTNKITKYQEQVNKAAVSLALDTPSLLGSRQKLLDLARKKVNREGYVYKKGKSRSIHFGDTSDHSMPKRPKMSENFRVKRLLHLKKTSKTSMIVSFSKEKGEIRLVILGIINFVTS